VQPVDGQMACDCQDYQRQDGPCNHALAVETFTTCERRDVEQSDPTPDHDNVTPLPTRSYADPDRFELTLQGHAALAADESLPLA
jgi:hypothetical protein